MAPVRSAEDQAELRRRRWKVNPKRVYRLMREDNLLCVRKRKFVVSDIGQLWVADITYIRLQSEFVYLGVVIDAYSRRVIGWALDRTVEDDLPLAALRSALELRRPSAVKTIAALDQLPLGLVPNRR